MPKSAHHGPGLTHTPGLPKTPGLCSPTVVIVVDPVHTGLYPLAVVIGVIRSPRTRSLFPAVEIGAGPALLLTVNLGFRLEKREYDGLRI